MVVLHCTRRLLRDARRHLPEATRTERSTTRLGGWYANRLNIGQQRYVIAVSAETLLPLVTPARDLSGLPDRIRDALDGLLGTIGIDDVARQREVRRMQHCTIGAAQDRSLISSLNAMAQRAYEELYDLPHRPGRTLAHIDVLLAGVSLAPLHYRTPAEATIERLTRRPVRERRGN